MEPVSKRSMTYIIGIPGSGKSTALAGALRDDAILKENVASGEVPFIEYSSGLIQVGRNRETYPGTDVLPYNAQPKVLKWLESLPTGAKVVAEGDRLANGKFFNALLTSDWDLKIIHIYARPVLGLKRSIERGSNFTESWYKSRVTKVDNIVANFIEQTCLTLDAQSSRKLLAGEIKNHLG